MHSQGNILLIPAAQFLRLLPKELTLLSALMRSGCTLMLSLTTETVALVLIGAALLGEVEMMA